MNLTCEVCGVDLLTTADDGSFDVIEHHQCDHVKEKFAELKQRNQALGDNLSEIKFATKNVLKSFNGNQVSLEDLQKLVKATDVAISSENLDEYLRNLCNELQVISMAHELFRTKAIRKDQTFLTRLKHLEESLSKIVSEEKEEEKLELTSEEVVQHIIRENKNEKCIYRRFFWYRFLSKWICFLLFFFHLS